MASNSNVYQKIGCFWFLRRVVNFCILRSFKSAMAFLEELTLKSFGAILSGSTAETKLAPFRA